jgi:tetratricopeptide (TPR) repeat protein/MFS family permease
MKTNDNVTKADDGYPAGLKWDAWLACGLGLLAGILYWAMSSGLPQPGMSAQMLAEALGLGFNASPLNPIWAALVRLGGGTAVWATALSAVSGAVSVGLLGFLVMRVRYAVHDRHDEDEGRREHVARYLAGTTAALFLAGSVPFWVASTQTMPQAFHLALLLLAAWVFSEIQRAGKAWRLALFGALYGVGLAEFPTFWLLAPLAGILIVRALLQRAEFRWSLVGVAAGAGAVAAAAAYAWAAAAALRFDAPTLAAIGVRGWWGAVLWLARMQARWAMLPIRTTGWLVVMGVTILPWCILFLLRAKKPAWRYGYWQTLLHLGVLGAGAAVMFGAPISPWVFYGTLYLMVTPMAILGACTGYVAGEFWVMGQTREHRRAGVGHWPRKVAGFLGFAVPFAAAAAFWVNQATADARKGDAVTREILSVASGLSAGDVVLTDGVPDELLEVALAASGKEGATVGSLPRMRADAYRTWLGEVRFTDPRSQSLLALGAGPFLQDWLGRAGDEAAALNTSEVLREFGEASSDGLTSRLGAGGTAAEEAERNRAFRERMEAMAGEALPKRNPAWAYRQWMLQAASKQANNTAFRLLEEGDEAGAEAVLLSARKMCPKNLSVLLNLWGMAARRGDGGEEAYREEWTAAVGPQEMQSRLWRLGAEYGYVYNTGMLIQQGMMWAVSGKPKQAEAELRRTQKQKGKDIDVELKAFLGQMYLFSGDQQQGEAYYRDVLAEKPDDAEAIHKLAELAIQQGRLDDAREGLSKLRELGIPAERLRFDELLLTAAEGRYGEAVAGLAAMADAGTADLRVWGAMAVLAGKAGDPGARERAIGALRKQKSKSPTTRLLLAHLLSGQGDWPAARAELEQLVRMNPGHAGAWEMLLRADYAERKRDQAEDHVRVLLTLEPGNAFGNLLLASFQRERGQLALAESSYRAALATQRTPMALNDLADLLMRRPEGRAEARALLDEALSLAPDDPMAHMTRAELGLLDGRFDEAEKDLQTVLEAYPGEPDAVLLAARLYAASGKREAALELAEELDKKRSSLSPESQEIFRQFQAELRAGHGNP